MWMDAIHVISFKAAVHLVYPEIKYHAGFLAAGSHYVQVVRARDINTQQHSILKSKLIGAILF